jgi:hypothetical protein
VVLYGEVVMPGLRAGRHVLASAKQGVDGRDTPGHDEREMTVSQSAAQKKSRTQESPA